ncbi:arylamine N-acetyltransferase [Paenibacillus alvei]
MHELNERLRQRIGFPLAEAITLQNLEIVLEKVAKTVPFENMAIIGGKTGEISPAYLQDKIIERKEGGLCYDINSLLYLFLRENGLNVALIKGITYDPANQAWSKTGATHACILLEDNGRQYVVDSGYGANLPLKPVPLDGELIVSDNGEFKIEQKPSEYGDYMLYVKLKDKDEDWRIGYAFCSTKVFDDVKELNEMQGIIVNHPASRFNKDPLLSLLTDKGSIVLTNHSFTEWSDGTKQKEDIDSQEFILKAKERFGIRS